MSQPIYSSGYTKDIPRLTGQDVISIVAKQTKLTQDDVRACFKAYSDFLEYMLRSDSRQENLEIAIPFVGNIGFRNMKGKKRSTYTMPADNGFGVTEVRVFEITEDKPNYQRLKFKFRPKLNKILREASSSFDKYGEN